jgi:hypothetical protein
MRAYPFTWAEFWTWRKTLPRTAKDVAQSWHEMAGRFRSLEIEARRKCYENVVRP